MKAKKLKLGDEVYFPKNDTDFQITEHIGKLVYIDNQTLSALKYGFDFGGRFFGNCLKANGKGFSIPSPTGTWLTESRIKQGYRVYSGKKLKKIKPGDTVRIVNQINKEMIGNVFVVQRGYKDKGFYNDAVSQQLKLIRISKRDKYKEPSPTPQQRTTDMNDQQIESEIQAKGLTAPRVTFGDALVMLKKGKRVCRAGWNGKGMWLIKIQGCNDIASLHGYGFGEYLGEPTFSDAVYMKTADNMLVPWLCNQTDMLAEDWMLVEG